MICRFLLKITFLCILIFQPYLCSQEKSGEVFLVFGGKTGWIGQKIVKLLENQNYQVYRASSRLENREEIEYEVDLIQPDFIEKILAD
ncbi:MAG: hypothetical protein K1000chlam3_01746 [Chlamydiae bacterium]|nr:hypothetical protein [Chlamydiota bacterium]